MTFGEIYDKIVYAVWGSSTPPAGTVGSLTGSEGIIANIHKRIQKTDNYWFMHETTAFNILNEVQGYNLPDDFKGEVSLLFKRKDQTYFDIPLRKIGLYSEQENYWQNDTPVEYPEFYAISGDSFILYNPPKVLDTETLELHMCYWKYLPRPSAFTGGGALGAESDDLTINGAEVIIGLAAFEILMGENEVQKATVFRQMGEEARRELQIQSKDHRNSKMDFVAIQDV